MSHRLRVNCVEDMSSANQNNHQEPQPKWSPFNTKSPFCWEVDLWLPTAVTRPRCGSANCELHSQTQHTEEPNTRNSHGGWALKPGKLLLDTFSEWKGWELQDHTWLPLISQLGSFERDTSHWGASVTDCTLGNTHVYISQGMPHAIDGELPGVTGS